jgi:probable O-glycosylation ligase (exosortase A-associated)
MRDLMFALMMVVAIPLAIARPLNAYLLWGWTAVVVPTSYFYGFMADARLNFFFALLTLLLILFGRVSLAGYQNNRVTWLYLAFLVHGTLAFFLAFPGNPINAQYYEIFVKGLFFCLVMPIFIRERVHIQAFLIVLVLGLALHGVLNGLKTLASGGAHNMIGPQGTMIGDRNHLSTALVLSLPLLFYLYQYTRSNLMRWGFLGGFILVVLAVVGSGSRGGFIALAVVAVWLVLASRRRWTVLFVTVPLAALIYVYAPAEWFSRLETIETAD